MAVKFYLPENQVPLEMHKVRVVQKLSLHPVEERKNLMQEAGNNTFLLHNKDIYMDMLTDSGVNAMSDLQTAAMMQADDAYAGSESFYRFARAVKDVFGCDYVLPAHQGRACENILSEAFVKPDKVTLMNFHFTTTKAHITRVGGRVIELVKPEGVIPQSTVPFKGDIDLERRPLRSSVRKMSVSSASRQAPILSAASLSVWRTCWQCQTYAITTKCCQSSTPHSCRTTSTS